MTTPTRAFTSASYRTSIAPMFLVLAVGCSGMQAARAASPARMSVETAAPGFTNINTDKSLITNGSVTATATDLLPMASEFRSEVSTIGARIVAEQLHYAGPSDDELHSELRQRPRGSSSASYTVKVLPSALPTLLDWLREHATITEEDVASIAAMESEADAAITGEAPDPIAAAADAHRVAVLRVNLESPPPYDPLAHGDFVASVRGSFLALNVLGAATSNRLGVGIALGGRSPEAALELTGYAASSTSKTAITASAGIGGYSAAFGNGQRTTFNPYLGVRLGDAYVDASYFTAAVDLGVELIKRGGIMWTASARPTLLLGTNSQLAVEVGTSVGIAF